MAMNYFSFVLKRLMDEKSRTFLTLLGIIIGVSAVVALISLSLGMQEAINNQFQQVGSNRIIIFPGGASSFMETSMSAQSLTDKDVKAVRNIQGVKYAEPIMSQPVMLIFNNQQKRAILLGLPTDKSSNKFLENTNLFTLSQGRNPKQGEKKVAVVGYDVANKIFDRKIKLGGSIKINGQKFRVIGIQEKVGSQAHDNMVRIPQSEFEIMFNYKSNDYSEILLETDPNRNIKTIKARVEDVLRKERHVKEGNEDFNVQTSSQILDSFRNILIIIQIVLIGIGSISLLVGGINITNTMYTSVLQRTREIGIMKAIGARNSDILILFLIESGLLGVIGGIFGVIIGFSISKAAQYIVLNFLGSNLLVIYFYPILIIGVLLFSFFIGVLSGLSPAYRAARLKPVDALRYE